MNARSARSLSSLASFLPDLQACRLWAVAVFLSALVWLFLMTAAPASHSLGANELAVLVGAAFLLGVAYGSVFAAVVLIGRVFFRKLGETVPLALPDSRAFKVALLMYLVHTASVGLLLLAGMWKPSWPWYFGLVPYIWQ